MLVRSRVIMCQTIIVIVHVARAVGFAQNQVSIIIKNRRRTIGFCKKVCKNLINEVEMQMRKSIARNRIELLTWRFIMHSRPLNTPSIIYSWLYTHEIHHERYCAIC
jgi:hypothetical protein